MPSLRDTAVPAAVVTVSHDGGTYPMRLDTASIVEGGAIQCEGARHDASIYTDYTVGGTTRDRLRPVAAIGSTQLVTLDIPGCAMLICRPAITWAARPIRQSGQAPRCSIPRTASPMHRSPR